MPSGIPWIQIPENYTTVANWFWDPLSGMVNSLDDAARDQIAMPTYATEVSIGGTPHRIGIRNTPAEAAGMLSLLDQNLAQWAPWLDTDPRSAITSSLDYLRANPSYNYWDSAGPGNFGTASQVLDLLSTQVASNALKQKLEGLGFTPQQSAQALEGLYSPAPSPGTGTLNGVPIESLPRPYIYDQASLNDPTWGTLSRVFKDAGIGLGLPYGPFGDTVPSVSGITDQQLLTAMQSAGLTIPTTTPTGNNGGTTVPNEDLDPSITLSQLNPFGDFLNLLRGRQLVGTDANGQPVYQNITGSEDYFQGGNVLFGPQQAQALKDYLTPLPMKGAETWAQSLLDPAALNEQFTKTLSDLDQYVLPGMKELSQTGFRTPTPTLFGSDQYGLAKNAAQTGFLDNRNLSLARNIAETGLFDDLKAAGMGYLNNELAPSLNERYAGQLGSFSSDFQNALAQAGEDVTTDLLKQKGANQIQGVQLTQGILNDASTNKMAGLGLWNDMTSIQGSLDAQLGESAAARRANALPLLNELSVFRGQLPISFANDVASAGKYMRDVEESTRPGARVLSNLLPLLGGSAPGQLGTIGQGKAPSETTALLSGLAPMTGGFGQANLGGGGFSSSFGSGLGQALGNLGGSLLGKGLTFGADALGGLLTSGWNALTGLFGGGGGGGNDNSYDFMGSGGYGFDDWF
jgi:hypothetical protein